MWGYIILAIIVIIVLALILIYNGLIRARNMVKNAFSQIDVQLQRRFDLIPNLVDTVKGYMKHERTVLEKVTELRSSWMGASTVSEKADISNQLTDALKTIMAVSENYPDLKASNNFLELQEELRNTENKISYARQFYNDSVIRYNNKLQVVPSNIVASMFHFTPEDVFKTESNEAKKNVRVNFND